MQKTLMIKLTFIAMLCLGFVIALAMIDGLVYERQAYQESITEEIKASQVGRQTLMTPFIILQDSDDQHTLTKILLPDQSQASGQLIVDRHKYARGIYRVTSFDGKFIIKQTYQPTNLEVVKPITLPKNHGYENVSSAKLIIPVSDLRGVGTSTVMINNQKHLAKFQDRPTHSDILGRLGSPALEVMLTPADIKAIAQGTNLSLELRLSGIGGLDYVPLGSSTQFQLAGNWAEPKFFGGGLPNQKDLGSDHFQASWQNNFLSQSNSHQLTSNFNCQKDCGQGSYRLFQTDLVDTNNAYTQTDRILKYALLLLIISFGAFFLFEILKGLRIHPIQYSLVAAALAVFYVLVLSLAEHLLFWQAYLISALTCSSLIGWYASHTLASFKRGLGFMMILVGLYSGFYMILSLEEMNLLLGSVFCLLLLFIVMFLTRKVDWYNINPKLLQDKINKTKR